MSSLINCVFLIFLPICALTIIDNQQLAFIKNDCYERLAIGHRHKAKDIYKKVDLIKTAKECQRACTLEKTKCKSLSFGVGTKGNTTCELGSDPIKETNDLKPIGTLIDIEYDLYIKKMDCTIVEPSLSATFNELIQTTVKPTYSENNDEIHHIKTMVAVSSGLNKPILHPVHNIFVGSYEENTLKPNRPPSNEYDNNNFGTPLNDENFNSSSITNNSGQQESTMIENNYEKSTFYTNYRNNIHKNNHHYQNQQFDYLKKPIISYNNGFNGGEYVSIITEIEKACFRRVLAGRRVVRELIRKTLICERLEDCQQECADEKRFICEGFNYRLDLKGKGECELLDIPLSHLDIARDTYPNLNYDYYEKDRNAINCNQLPYNDRYSPYFKPSGESYLPPPPPPPPLRPSQPHSAYLPPSRPIYPPRLPQKVPPSIDYDRRPSSDVYSNYNNRRGDFHYKNHYFDSPGYHNIPHQTSNYHHHHHQSYEPYLPLGKFNEKKHFNGNSYRPSSYESIIPLPPQKDWNRFMTDELLPPKPTYSAEPSSFSNRDECSLRTATGFRLHKGIVKKFNSVPNLYECELLCFKEIKCSSYAFRYTVNVPTDNCYISDKKQLDFYTDLQPDRDFDVYTMNNDEKCKQPIIKEKSECFWRIRSGQRLDEKIVKDSLTVKSIIECQIECLHSISFTCRGFTFRYGPPIIGGIIDNCQLTDWPYFELESHLIPEQGFELYERGSYGHGCQPDHFVGRKDPTSLEQLCYIGFGQPALLLPKATRKILTVISELDCKKECSKTREDGLFKCMSFSYKTNVKTNNCLLSDIMERDLLPNIDYISDKNSWLFSWDVHNQKCVNLKNDFQRSDDILYPIDTWKVYSVNGLPCRGLCQENREAGFWYCQLGKGDRWDYCCRPDHQCGYSEGFPYQWCYVGPERTQWRKCSDHYYPYTSPTVIVDKIDKPFHHQSASLSNQADDKPSSLTLDEYEEVFNQQFLDPPKPGGLGRHWPISYLHKENPFGNNDTNRNDGSERKPRYEAIENLINVIKSNENIKYQIKNDSKEKDDILVVKIPLPGFSSANETLPTFEIVNLDNSTMVNESQRKMMANTRPIYRKSYIERTNSTRNMVPH